MAAEQPSEKPVNVFDTGLNLYRRTLKRLRPVHRGLHWLLSHTLIPVLERSKGLKTMPDDPLWFRLELLTDRHEPETTALIRQLARPGMTVLDVGAHVGYYARMCSAAVGPQGRVIALEPHPRNHSYLLQNLKGRSNVTALQVAAAEAEGIAELYDYLMMSASGSLHYDERLRDTQRAQLTDDDFAPRMASGHQVETFTVRTAPLDDLLGEQGISRVDLVKMDIEGAEMGALRGMTRTIQQSPDLALVMEYNPMGLRAFDVDPAAALHEIQAMGFARTAIIQPDGSLQDITSDAAAVEKLTADLTAHMGVVNLLFTRRPA